MDCSLYLCARFIYPPRRSHPVHSVSSASSTISQSVLPSCQVPLKLQIDRYAYDAFKIAYLGRIQTRPLCPFSVSLGSVCGFLGLDFERPGE